MGILAEAPKKSKSESSFEQKKLELKAYLLNYYKKDYYAVNEIKERIGFMFKALDSFDKKTFESMKSKIKITWDPELNANANAKQKTAIEFIVLFSQYYAGFIFAGEEATKEHYLLKNKVEENFSLKKEYKKTGEFERHLDNIEIRGAASYSNVGLMFNKAPKDLIVTDIINVINTTMHEKAHAFGTIIRGEQYGQYNEFATSFLMPFYLPIRKKDDSKKMQAGTRILNYRMNDFEKRKDYVDVEYVEYFFTLPFLYDADKEKISKFLQKNMQIKNSSLNRLFDRESALNWEISDAGHMKFPSSAYHFCNKLYALKDILERNLEYKNLSKKDMLIIKEAIKSVDEMDKNSNIKTIENAFEKTMEIKELEDSKMAKELKGYILEISSLSKSLFVLKNLISVFEEYNSEFGHDKYFKAKKETLENLYAFISNEKILNSPNFNRLYYQLLREMVEWLEKIKSSEEMKDYSLLMPKCQNREKFA